MLTIKNVNKKYWRKEVLHDVSFEIEPGEITGLIGINGTGKTTLMKAIMNLIPINGGVIHIDDEPITQNTMERIIYIPDQTIALPSMTIEQGLEYMDTYYQNFNWDRANDLLDFFKLNKEDFIADLSNGNRRKVNLLFGFAVDSDYILLDEPFNGIDIFSREEIRNIFTTDLLAGKGILISTHDIQEIDTFIDHVIIIDNGYVYKDFKAEDVRLEGKSVMDVFTEVYQK